jgi:ubiquinol-cytochrome c reductase cytochrome b subunit
VIKDLFALAVILVVFFAIVGFMPNYLGHPDNYIEANPLVTPAHIVPEWYFLPFYAILRAFDGDVWVVIAASFLTGGIVDAAFFGVLAMFGAIVVMALAPWLDTSSVRSGRYRPMFKWWFWLFIVNFFVLMWVGRTPGRGYLPLHRTDRHDLLVRLFPGDPAASGCDRETAAAGRDDRRGLHRALRQIRQW